MRGRLLAAAVIAGTALAAPAVPAAAAACSGSSGVTVVVDFASLGGGVPTRCAPGDPPSGLAALRGAGFEPTRVASQPGYFVCRIDGRPASDPCQRTPPADAYWSSWTAVRGGRWRFADTGAAERDPAPGTVDGWAFGAGDPPSVPPPAAGSGPSAASSPARPGPSASREASPSPAPRATGGGGRAGGAPAPPASSVATPAARATPAPGSTSEPLAPGATGGAAGGPGPTSSDARRTPSAVVSAAPPAADAEPLAAGDDRTDGTGSGSGSGFPTGPLAAAVVIALLVAGAARQARRR